jgi:hypothetical protein
MNAITWGVQAILIVGATGYFIVPWAKKSGSLSEMPPVGGTPFVGLVIVMTFWLLTSPLTVDGLGAVLVRYAAAASWFVAFMLNLALARRHRRLKRGVTP